MQRVLSLLLVSHDVVPLIGDANADKQDIALLKRDIAIFSNLYDVAQSDLVRRECAILDAAFLCPGGVIDEHSAACDPCTSPVLHADSVVGPV